MRILFVDPDHGPRSQMAAALLGGVVRPGVSVSSAGTQPGGRLDGVAEVMGEVGGIEFTPTRIELARSGPAPELLIVVCEEGCLACPYVPGSGEVRRWPTPDPSGVSGAERRTLLRKIRDDLVPMVRSLAQELS